MPADCSSSQSVCLALPGKALCGQCRTKHFIYLFRMAIVFPIVLYLFLFLLPMLLWGFCIISSSPSRARLPYRLRTARLF